jgi:hypothetical protein
MLSGLELDSAGRGNGRLVQPMPQTPDYPIHVQFAISPE